MDDIRPEWRSLMLCCLRFFVRPLTGSFVPCPVITITSPEMKSRMVELAQDNEPSFEHGDISAAALLEATYAKSMVTVPLQKTIEFYQGLDRVKTLSPKRSFTPKDVFELVKQSEYLWGGAVFHPGWTSIFSAFQEPVSQSDTQFFEWYWRVFIVAFYRYGIPFPTILYIARVGPDTIAMDALCQAITVEKKVMDLPWVQRRIEEAKDRNDRPFLHSIKQALKKTAVPKDLRGRALDFFLCVFNPWLNELSIAEQAALIRDGNIAISEKALRNRRNRLKLTNVDKKSEIEIPPEIERLIEQTQSFFGKPLPP